MDESQEEGAQGPGPIPLSEPSHMLLAELHELNVNLDSLNDNLGTIAQMVMVLLGSVGKQQGKPLEQLVQEGLSNLVRNLFDMLGVDRSEWPPGF